MVGSERLELLVPGLDGAHGYREREAAAENGGDLSEGVAEVIEGDGLENGSHGVDAMGGGGGPFDKAASAHGAFPALAGFECG